MVYFKFFRELEGVVSLPHLTTKVVSQGFQLNEIVEKAMFKKFHKVTSDTSLGFVSRLLETDEFVVVVDREYHCTGIITHLNLLSFISKGAGNLKNGV